MLSVDYLLNVYCVIRTEFIWTVRECQCELGRGLRRGSVADRLLALRFRIPPATWMSVSCECCVLAGRGLCDRPIARPESPPDCGVSECDREGGPGPLGAVALWTTIQY